MWMISKNVLDLAAIKQAGIKIGVDPLGGSGVAYWDVIAKPTVWTSRW
jgi:phosphoglucomutase